MAPQTRALSEACIERDHLMCLGVARTPLTPTDQSRTLVDCECECHRKVHVHDTATLTTTTIEFRHVEESIASILHWLATGEAPRE